MLPSEAQRQPSSRNELREANWCVSCTAIVVHYVRSVLGTLDV